MTMSRRTVIWAWTGLVLLMPVVTWWLVGDVSEDPVRFTDYMLRPFDLTTAQQSTAGWAGLALMVLAMMALSWGTRQGSTRRSDLGVVAPLLLAGVYVGFTHRVMTAGVVGANIGGSILFLTGLLLVPALSFCSFCIWLVVRSRRRDSDRVTRPT